MLRFYCTGSKFKAEDIFSSRRSSSGARVHPPLDFDVGTQSESLQLEFACFFRETTSYACSIFTKNNKLTNSLN